ncbi:hypothetical protein PR202_gb29016 [Eleusine coracana subsp. coracana]|uniref:Acetyltransferase n=1 Tax=Eleusine coracana subsp. coracana TaxID=191504 RepID=A0AAV5FVX9_ELECO|nr:hypothetical protein PR202_gb29016 [Eleusine coracana subsp. coracana]
MEMEDAASEKAAVVGSRPMEGDSGGGVRVLSRRSVRPLTPPPPTKCNGSHHQPNKEEEEIEVIHLTPWDLRLISIDYIQKGILLPKPPSSGAALVNALASSFSRALGRFYSFAGRLAADEREDGTVTLSVRCTGDGAEFVRAVAPEVTVADIVSSLYVPKVVWAFYPLREVLGADAALAEPSSSIPLVSVQVTELADGVFIGMSLNHSAGDGTAFWHLFNTWSEIHRRGGSDIVVSDLNTPAPVLKRWFVEGSPIPIPMPFPKLEHIVRRFDRTAVQECFFTFSVASVKKLKARANAEMKMAGGETSSPTISSLQAVLAHLWRAVCRARRLPPEQPTFYSVVVGCRGRVAGIPAGYVGNAMVFARADATAGEVEQNGLGWTARLLNRAVASFDEDGMRESLAKWVGEPDFAYMDKLSSRGTALVTGSSPRFDVFGNDFGWGKPVAVRSGSGNKADGKATVYEGPERGGSVSLEVCIAPDALARLVVDQEFMEAVSAPA